MVKMKVGLVGCGNIGADLCIQLQKGTIPAEFAALTDIAVRRAEILVRTFKLKAKICSLEENAASVDLLIECAAQEAVPEVVEAAIRNSIDCMVLSVSGLMEHPDLIDRARENSIQIHIPSGALCGLDGIRAAMEAGLHRVTLTTRKPPKGFDGAPYLAEKDIDLEALMEPMVLFEGSALEAVRAFPQSLNVAALLSVAGIGPHETKVRIVADPAATLNCHEVVAEGAFGRLQTVTQNLPSPRNARSSYLASLSASTELRKLATAFVTHTAAAEAL